MPYGIGLIALIILGIISALISYYIFKIKTVGSYISAAVAGIFGAILGSFLFDKAESLLQSFQLNINTAGAILGAILLIKILHVITPKTYK